MPFNAQTRAAAAKAAAQQLATATTQQKNDTLRALAANIEARATDIRAVNNRDMQAARDHNIAEPLLRRLELTDTGIAQLVDGIRQVADLPDPVGAEVRGYDVPSGLHVSKVRCPIGVVLMIYESRPGVTVDAFALCFKAGNACILKGGREALHSNLILTEIARDTLAAHDLPVDAMTLVDTSDRDVMKQLLHMEQYIDLAIPRGGNTLVSFVHEHARMPTVQHFHGVCHIYVDAQADLEKAVDICASAKLSAPATCNALECLLVNQNVADQLLPPLAEKLRAGGVELRGDETVCKIIKDATPATDADWGTEFLGLTLAIKIVPDLNAAIDHIHRYSSNHTDAILTEDPTAQQAFVQRVQSSCVLINASTRFNDGFQLGLGAEIGISTSRIHAYGPMGLEELTTQRYVVTGDGQWR